MKKRRSDVHYPRKKMRMINFILCYLCFCCFGVSQQTLHAQNKEARVTLKFKEIGLKQLFAEIEKQTSFAFVYRVEDLNGQKPVTVDVVNEKLTTVLNRCLEGTGLTFMMEGNNVLIKRSAKMTSPRFIEISGRVKDKEGVPLPGATVMLQGTTLGVVTDSIGNFRFKFTDVKNVVISISFIGMKTKVIDLKGQDLQKPLIVTLEEDVQAMDDVVVTGYSNFKKTSFTGKAISVKGEDLKKVASRNIISALQAFDPSLRIKENNKFGSDPNALPEFSIRGNSSIGITGLEEVQNLNKANLRNNTNLPLFVMDGFEVSVEKVYDMDINRIETINILKDAAATAMYGSRAANGVVVITTVKPKAGEVSLTYNFLAEFSVPDLSDYNLMNASEKLETERLGGVYQDKDPNEQINLEKEYYEKLQLVQKGINTDWLAQPLDNVFNHKHTLYIEGGSGDAMRFGVDFKYDRNNGVMKGSFRQGISVGLNLEYLLEKLQIRNSLSYNVTNSEESPYGYFSDYSRKQPYERYDDDDGALLLKTNSLAYNDQNPLYDALHVDSYNESKYDELTENFNVNWMIMEGLQLRGTLGVILRNGSSARFVDPASSKYKLDEDPAERGTLDLTQDRSVNLDGNVMFYLYKYVNDHMFNGNIGINVRQTTYNQSAYNYRGFPLGTMDQVTYARKIVEKPNTEEQTTRLFGYVASLNYSYKDIYLADISGRLDGSSEFGTNNKFAPFWAFGLGLNVHKYKFMNNLGWLPHLKVRGSLGQLGKVNFPAYAAMTQYRPYDEWYSTGSASNLVYMGNPDLKWEITSTKDLGMEIGLFPGKRLYLDLSYYHKRTQDLITSVTIPTSSGFKEYRDNMGEIINKGFEIDLRYQVVNNKNMTLILLGNMGHNENKIGKISASLEGYNKKVEDLLNEQVKANISNSEVRYEPITRYVEGGSTTAIFAMRSAGIDPANGKEKFIRRDGTSTYDYNAVDEVIVGDELPELQGSFGLNFYYYGFSLYATFMYEIGAQKYNSTLVNAVENADISYSNVDKRVLYDRWVNPGDKTPLKDIKDRENRTKPTSRFVQDDNWLSLSYMSLGYDVNPSLLKKIGLRQCNFQLSTSSPFRWSSIKRERGTSYPYARTFNFSMNLMF